MKYLGMKSTPLQGEGADVVVSNDDHVGGNANGLQRVVRADPAVATAEM